MAGGCLIGAQGVQKLGTWAAYDDLFAFKIYLVDIGLLRRLAQPAPTAFGEGNRLFTEFKGALTENYVLQTLVTQFELLTRY